MARGTEEQEQASEVSADFPYRTLMTHPAWAILDEALADLESNDDLELQTARRYVIGYLIQQLAAQGLIPPAIAFRPDTPNAPAPQYRWILQLESSLQGVRQRRPKKAPLPDEVLPRQAQPDSPLNISVTSPAPNHPPARTAGGS